MANPGPPQVFDRRRLRERRNRVAPEFGQYAFLKRHVSNQLIERLADTAFTFDRCLDLGAQNGAAGRALRQQALDRWIVSADLGERFAHQCDAPTVAADEEALPFTDGAFDLIVSALGLHWVNDLPGALVQIRRALRPDGLFIAALFGAGALAELRVALAEAETELRGGAAVRLPPLPRLQDMAGLLQRTGFALPVADRDTVLVRYASMFELLRDLGGMGERNCLIRTPARGLSRAILLRAAEIYQERFSDPDGRVRASFELVWLSGWAPADHQPKPLRPGSAKMRLADALGVAERPAGEKTGRT